jgi:polysaccharide biosynthesis/export protein ExoF
MSVRDALIAYEAAPICLPTKSWGSISGGLRHVVVASMLVLCSEGAFAQAIPGTKVQPPPPMTYSVGDRLKVSFYEPLTMPDKTNWASIGKPQLPGPSYYLHPELSGDYSIQSDWTISIPMIGTVLVARRDAKDVETDLTKAFERIIGHSGFVGISVVERKPLYIIGPVKQQGAYKYEPGLTPLNLVALAGGVLRNQEDRWAVVEAVREAGKEQAATERLCRLLAQKAVLQAELLSTPAELPAPLIRLKGRQQAEQLVNAEQARRAPVIQAHVERRKALQVTVAAAQSKADVDNTRLPLAAEGIDARHHRMTALETLVSHGTINRVVMDQVRGELSDAKDRQANVFASLGEDMRALAVAKIDATRFETQTKVELDQAVAALQREIDELTPTVAANTGIIGLLKSDTSGGHDALQFEIIRSSQVLPAGITTPLEPGDLLSVRPHNPASLLSGGDAEENSGPKQLSRSTQ